MSSISNPNPDDPPASKQDCSQTLNPMTGQGEELIGLPFFKTWRGVYLFVFSCFALWVLLLLALTNIYSS
ncbi:MAG TPA: hypothetical protein VGN23_12040 [Verrucomicrobiae bacterium]|jgi:hypothetical protein